MDKKRRKLLKIFAKGCGAAGLSAAGAVATSAFSGTAKPFLGSGEGILKVDRYEADAQEDIQRFQKHYGIPDPDKAKELYRKVVAEAGAHGVGGGVVGLLLCKLANATFGKGSATSAFTSIVTAPWIAEGVARASHETFLDEGARVPYGFEIIGINQETFSLDQVTLMNEYGMSLRNASRLCDDCRQLSLENTDFVSQITSAAYHAVQLPIHAWIRRKEAVAMKEALAGDADFEDVPVGDETDVEFQAPKPGDEDVVDAVFQEIKLGKNGQYVPVDDTEEPLP